MNEFITQFDTVSAPEQAAKLRFDALEPRGRRKTPIQRIAREDIYLRGDKRTKLQATATDIVRNFSIAAWAVRRHLDYVSRFEFQSYTGDDALDKQIEAFIAEASHKENFDRGARFSREKAFRTMEARRVLDGDAFLVLLQSGQVQGIESDLVRDPPKDKMTKAREWVDGIEIDGAGQPFRYAVHSRENGSTYKYVRNVSAYNVIHYGFFDRWASEQVRGVSPIVASLNNYRDVYENIDYALVRSKLSQIFAVALTRDKEFGLENEFPPAGDDGTDLPDETVVPPRELDLSNGPTVLDFDPGEKVELLESRTPSNELQQFSRLVVMIALKSLDIPYSFFDEAHTNYSGSRTSWLQYERACMDRRDDQIDMRRRWTTFRLQKAVLDGDLVLPRGMTVGDLKYKWIPKGMPWWKPSEELTADLKAIAAGLTSPQEVCAKNGLGDPKDHIAATCEIIRYARELGDSVLGEPMRLNFDPGPFPSAITDSANQPDANP